MQSYSNLKLPQLLVKAFTSFLRFLEKISGCNYPCASHSRHKRFPRIEKASSEEQQGREAPKKHKKSKHASDDSKFFKIRFYKKTETQERREKKGNRKFSQLTTVCEQSHMSYSVLESVSGCIPDVHHIQDKNDFKGTKLPAANISKNKTPKTVSQD